MIQHGEGGVRFSSDSGGTAVGEADTRLPRPDNYDGCWNCALRTGDTCPEFEKPFRGLSGMGACRKWKLRSS